MSENSRKKKTRAVEGRDGCSEQDGHYRCGMAKDVEWETVETDVESGEDDDRQNRQPADRRTTEHSSMTASPANIGLRRSTLLSSMLLSLLPLPTAAYPQSKSNTIRRDRRRSSNVKSSRGSERHSSERSEGFGRTEGMEEGRRVRESNNGDATMCSVENEGSTVDVQSSEQTIKPTPTTVFYRRADTTAATSVKTTSYPVEVPITALPYKLTKGDEGWTTVEGGWTLYGRASVESTHHALADTDATTDDNSTTSAFNITAALPAGWGQDSERGDLYAVPLIVVASVCMALLFMAFVVLVVISRAKAKRKAERKIRRREVREKRERRERRVAARAAQSAVGLQPISLAEERRDSSVNGSTHSHERARDRFDSTSSSTDSEDHRADADSSRRPSGSGTTSTTVRLAKQQALAAAAAAAVESSPPTRAGRAKKRFGWTSAVNLGAANVAAGPGSAVSTARLGDPRRVWGWKKGLRRRRAAVREGEQDQTGSRDERAESVIDAAEVQEESQRGADAQVVSPTTSPEVDSSSSPSRSPRADRGNEQEDTQPGVTAESSNQNGLPASPASHGPDTTEGITERPPVSAFPPAYYRTTSGSASPSNPADNAGPSLSAHDGSTANGRVTDAGPSARAMEKRPMPGVGYDDYFPAPTTEEQEEAVNIAYNRNVALAGISGDPSSGPAPHPANGEHSGATGPVPTGAGGHVATDDKQVLERLRLAGSAPPTADGADAVASGAQQSSATATAQEPAMQASAPELQVDEDGFETLEDLLPPSETEQDTSIATSSSATSYPAEPNMNVLPLPPARVTQRSLAYAEPSAPPGISSSPVIASAPSAPYEEDHSTGLDGDAPSAPPLDIDAFHAPRPEQQSRPEPSAPGSDSPPQDDSRVTEDGEDVSGSSSSRRFTVPHRTLGIDLPSDLAAPPAFPHSEEATSSVGAAVNAISSAGAPRYLPRYEP